MKKNLDIIVCRSGKKGHDLTNILNKQGYNSYFFPTFSVNSIPFRYSTLYQGGFTDIIFVSVNAVDYFFSSPIVALGILKRSKVWSIGKGTAHALKQYSVHSIYPCERENSEELLSLVKADKTQTKRRFLLVKGQGGRKYLIDELKSYKLSIIECYRRCDYSREYLVCHLSEIFCGYYSNVLPTFIIFTSVHSLKAAIPIFDMYPSWKYEITITVTNIRMLSWAKLQGFTKLLLIQCYDNDAIVVAIEKAWKNIGQIF
jgi:uroporphyrinogen-III synthase